MDVDTFDNCDYSCVGCTDLEAAIMMKCTAWRMEVTIATVVFAMETIPTALVAQIRLPATMILPIVDDGSCKELDQCGVCGGTGLTCLGCLDSLACNFDSLATIDEGGCLYGSEDLTVFVRTDNWPTEFFWSLKDGEGPVVYAGGPYLDPASDFVETLCFSPGCYTASIFDLFGDGICCHPYFGDGFISFTSNGVQLGRADDFGYSKVIEICIGTDYGCIDEAACNFDEAASIENNTCEYPAPGFSAKVVH